MINEWRRILSNKYFSARLTMDTINNRLLVLDSKAEAVIAVDLENGQPVALFGVLVED